MRQAGALPCQIIEQFIQGGHIRARTPVPPGNVQPASLDLRLGSRAHRVRAAFVPLADETIEAALEAYSVETLNLEEGVELLVDRTYVAEIAEEFHLPPGVHAYTNNKSSTGRMNVWVRTLVDRQPRFDKIPAGYRGRVYAMITPRSWPLRVAAGTTLNQARFLKGENRLTDLELEMAQQQLGLVYEADGRPGEPVLDAGVLLTVDLRREVAGYEALPGEEPVDLTRSQPHDGSRYFRPVRSEGGEVFLRKGGFYILSTREYLRVPPLFAVEMVAYDIHSGEYRSHYAGFFDPGFGYGRSGEVRGTPAVLEVDTHEDVVFRHGQPICKMVYEHLIKTPERIYGADVPSHYQYQRGPQLGRQFTMPADP